MTMHRVILVGCGFMGRMHASVLNLLPNAILVALVDHKRENADRIGAGVPIFSTLQEALDSVEADVVDICLPTHLHAEFTVAAAASGRHVFCEKPMAMSSDDAQRMIEACRSAGVHLMIGHCIRFWPEYVALKELVDGGRLGRLLSLNLTRYGAFPIWSSDNWLADEKLAGGGAFDMHIHDTDFVLYLLGEPDEVFSRGTMDHRGVSQIFTTMAYADGTIAHLEGGWNLPPTTPFKMSFRAIFERGSAIWDGGPFTIYPEDGEPEVPVFEQMSAEGGGNISSLGGYFHEMDYFLKCLESGRPVEQCTPESARRSVEVCLSEIHQVKQGRVASI
jgi:UDP-N-acetylglucosamine 3-dehydrogenase